MKNQNLFDEAGFLTEEGQKHVADTLNTTIFHLAENQSEVLMIASMLKSYIGNIATNIVIELKKP